MISTPQQLNVYIWQVESSVKNSIQINSIRNYIHIPKMSISKEAVNREEGDIIYPVFVLDDTRSFRSVILGWTLRFNDVLDPEKLHTSLSSLLNIGDWRKMGGRLRLKVRLFDNYF